MRRSKHGIEAVDTSGVDVVIKALKDLVIFQLFSSSTGQAEVPGDLAVPRPKSAGDL